MRSNRRRTRFASIVVGALCVTLAVPAAAEGKKVTVAVDAGASTVGFAASREAVEHVRHFARLDGSVTFSGSEPVAFEVAVDMSSLVGGEDELGRDLASKRFFNVAKFPLSRFESTSVAPMAGEDATHEVTGYLRIRGKRVKVTFPAIIEHRKGVMRGEAVIMLNRKDFGLSAEGPGGDIIRDHVYLAVVIVCKYKKK